MKFIHPYYCSEVIVILSENVLLEEVFNYLIEQHFISTREQWNDYVGLLMHLCSRMKRFKLDNRKTVGYNGVKNGDTIQILVATWLWESTVL